MRRASRTAPYTPAMRRLIALAVAGDAVRLRAAVGGGAAPTDPVRILTGDADHARSGGPGRRRQRGDHGPAVRVADHVRRGPAAPAGPRRVVAVRGRRAAVIFHLRPGLTFSDGTPLRAVDVVRSWLRLIDPAAAVAARVAHARRRGRRGLPARRRRDPAAVGLHADDAAGDVTVDLVRPATDFVDIVAGPDVRGRARRASARTRPRFAPGTDFVGERRLRR